MIYEFDGFVLDSECAELRHHQGVVHLEPKTYAVLLLLVQNTNRIVTKNEILDQIWPNLYVTEASLSGAIKQIRRALGDDGANQRFIKTIRGKGFRFIAALAQRPPRAANPHAIETSVEERTPKSSRPVIAVLPFNLLGTDETHRAIADAIPIELISSLSKTRSMSVIARGSSFRFNPLAIDYSQIRQRLGATYVLSGAVELNGRYLSVFTELSDTRRQEVVWNESFSAPLDDVFHMRWRIIEAVTSETEFRIPLHEAELAAKAPTEDLDAWGHYHVGIRHLFRFNGPDNDTAAHHFERALQLDPRFARALAGLSHTEFEKYNLGFGTEKARHLSAARTLAEDAVGLDAFDPLCNLVLGRALWIQQEVDQALAWIDRSIELNPNYAFGHYNSGKLNAITCIGETADRHVQSAMTLSPLDPHMQSMLSARALAAFVQDSGEHAISFADRSLRAPNAHIYVCVIAAAIHASYGKSDGVRQAQRQIEKLNTSFDKKHFLSLFTLRDSDRNAVFLSALERLGL
ncbi:MAG: winged helix-turn-helix domain-containing protein [Pseudomonadota bacterium]